MNNAYHNACIALFLLVPPSALVVRFTNPKRMPWWLLVVLVGALCWVLVNLAVYFFDEYLDQALAQAGGVEHAPQDLIDRWQNDGAKRVFALFFGWLYGLIYLAPWLVLYWAAQLIRRALAPSNQRLERP